MVAYDHFRNVIPIIFPGWATIVVVHGADAADGKGIGMQNPLGIVTAGAAVAGPGGFLAGREGLLNDLHCLRFHGRFRDRLGGGHSLLRRDGGGWGRFGGLRDGGFRCLHHRGRGFHLCGADPHRREHPRGQGRRKNKTQDPFEHAPIRQRANQGKCGIEITGNQSI